MISDFRPFVGVIVREGPYSWVFIVVFRIVGISDRGWISKVSPINKIKRKIIGRFPAIALEAFNQSFLPISGFVDRRWFVRKAMDPDYYRWGDWHIGSPSIQLEGIPQIEARRHSSNRSVARSEEQGVSLSSSASGTPHLHRIGPYSAIWCSSRIPNLTGSQNSRSCICVSGNHKMWYLGLSSSGSGDRNGRRIERGE